MDNIEKMMTKLLPCLCGEKSRRCPAYYRPDITAVLQKTSAELRHRDEEIAQLRKMVSDQSEELRRAKEWLDRLEKINKENWRQIAELEAKDAIRKSSGKRFINM